MSAATSRNIILLYLRYGVYDSPVLASFHCSKTSGTKEDHGESRTYGPDDCLHVVLTSEIWWGSTGVVHRGRMNSESPDGVVGLDVVVKLAFDSERCDALQRNYANYCELKSRGGPGLVTVLGLFEEFGSSV